MKRSKLSEKQAVYALRQVEEGSPVGEHLPTVGSQRRHVLMCGRKRTPTSA